MKVFTKRLLSVLVTFAIPLPVVQAASFDASDGYSGVYSVYAAARLSGIKDLSLPSLIEETQAGMADPAARSMVQRPEDLVRAAGIAGLPARHVSFLTRLDLFALPKPIAVRIKPALDVPEHDGWSLVLSASPRRAEVVGGDGRRHTVAMADLLVRMDGEGVILADAEVSTVRRWAGSGFGVGLAAVGLCVAVVGTSRVKASTSSQGDAWRVGLLLAVAAAGAALHGMFNGATPLRHAEARAGVIDFHAPSFWPTTSTDDLYRGLTSSNRPVVIDARSPSSFAASHVPTSRNVYAWSSDDDFARGLEGIATDAKIVIYCQTPRCDFADRVGRRLIAAGYGDIHIYRAGFVAWQERGLPVTVASGG